MTLTFLMKPFTRGIQLAKIAILEQFDRRCPIGHELVDSL
jgi:hypothetical protein